MAARSARELVLVGVGVVVLVLDVARLESKLVGCRTWLHDRGAAARG